MGNCPLYKSAQDEKPWTQANGAHQGLIFDKFGDAWTHNERDAIGWEFNKPVGKGQPVWLTKFAKRVPGDKDQLAEACERQRVLVEAQGGKVLLLKNTTRFVTGMGRNHPIENGFAWHHTLGTPYLPGSSLKGVLRAWLHENEDKRKEEWFGSLEVGIGRITLLDMLPTTPPKLAVDVMTPHYSPYYQKGDTPGDWHGPNPIQFLTVEQGASWQVGVLIRQGDQQPIDANEVKKLLTDAVEWGAGAKTAVGYGAFKYDEAKSQQLEDEAEAARAERERKEQLQAELENLSEHAAELKKLAVDQNWEQDDATALLDGLAAFKEREPKPDADAIELIRQWLDSRYAGIWENPDKTTGKKKKPAFKERPVALVKHFKQFE